jgi:hypothetical protein
VRIGISLMGAIFMINGAWVEIFVEWLSLQNFQIFAEIVGRINLCSMMVPVAAVVMISQSPRIIICTVWI